MKELLTRPYELSVWRDVEKTSNSLYWPTDDIKNIYRTSDDYKLNYASYCDEFGKYYRESLFNDYFDEEKIAIIGASTMHSGDRAVNIVLTEGINTQTKITFDIYSRYFDESVGEYVHNPYFDLMVNEAHLKLKHGDKWYDFLIKEISQTDVEYKYSIVAKDMFVNELSKNGYEIVFSEELENNIGTIEDFASEVVKNTDWEYKVDNIYELVEEPIYTSTLKKDLEVVRAIPLNPDVKKEMVTLSAGTTIYVFYSPLINQSETLQFLYKENGFDSSDLDDDGIIVHSEKYNYYIEKEPYKNNLPVDVAVGNICIDMRGKRLARSPKTTVDNGKVVSVYEKDGQEYYGYEEHVYVTPDIVQNILPASEGNFIKAETWDGTATIDMDTIPPLNDELPDNWSDSIKQYMFVNFTTDNQAIYNNCFRTNPEAIFNENTNYTSNKDRYLDISAGNKFVIRYRASQATKLSDRYVVYNESKDLIPSIVYKDSSIKTLVSFKALTEEDDYYDELSFSEEGDKYTVFIGETKETLKYSDINYLNVQLQSTKGLCGIQDIQFFKLVTWNKDGKDVACTPGMEIAETEDMVKTKYLMYIPGTTAVNELDNIDEYNAVYDENFRKYRSIEAEKTNRFDIIQTINETFECWSKLEVERAPNGSLWIESEPTFIKIDDIYSYPGRVKFRKTRVTADTEEVDNMSTSDSIEGTYFVWENGYLYKYAALPPVLWPHNKLSPNIGASEDCDRHLDELYMPDTDLEIYPGTSGDIDSFAPNNNIYNYPSDNSEDNYPEDSLYITDDDVYIGFISRKKVIHFYPDSGLETGIGFYYGLNTTSVERTINSDDIITKLIVENNSNENGLNGMCSIARAKDNPTKANFLLNFDYYINTGLLDRENVYKDLYGITIDDETEGLCYLTLYAQYNRELEEKSKKLNTTDFSGAVARAEANKQYYEGMITSNKQTELEIYSAVLDGYGIDLRDMYNKNKSPGTIDLKKYGEDAVARAKAYYEIRKKLPEFEKGLAQANSLLDTYNNLQDDYNRLLEEIKNKLKDLDNAFFQKYGRYIQEGTWESEDYYDDNLYYYDALSSLFISKSPEVSYNFNLIDIGVLNKNVSELYENFEIYDFTVGDKTFIVDEEIFGKDKKQDIVITEISYDLENPTNNSITVQNYRTEFADLFSRFAAATKTVELKQGAYNKAAAMINTDGTINSTALLKSIGNTNVLTFGNTSIGEGGIISQGKNAEYIRIKDGAISVSSNGIDWKNLVTAGDVSGNQIGGSIDIGKVTIGDPNKPSFKWDVNGLNAYTYEENEPGSDAAVNFSKFVRFDKFGMYGYKGYIEDDLFTPKSVDELLDNEHVKFGFVWDNFFLRTGTGTGMVKISADEDIQVIDKGLDNEDIARISIGRIGTKAGTREVIANQSEIDADPTVKPIYETQSYEKDKYGLMIRNDLNEPVMETDDDGQLWLRQKMRIGKKYDDESEDKVVIGFVKGYDELNKETDVDGAAYAKIFSVKGQKGDYFNYAPDLNETFAIFDNGFLYAQNAQIEGTIKARDGEIAGFKIENDRLHKTALDESGQSNTVIVSPHGIALGTRTGSSVVQDAIKAQDFYVTPDGFLQAKNANILGKLTTSVFEKNTTRVVGGVSLFKTAEIIDTSLYAFENNSYTTKEIIIKGNGGVNNFNIGDRVGIIGSINSRTSSGNTGTEDYYIVENIDEENNKIIIDRNIELLEDYEYLIIQLDVDDNYMHFIDRAEFEEKLGQIQMYKLVNNEFIKWEFDFSDDFRYAYYKADKLNEMEDWFIGVNSTGQRRAFNLMPNSITFNRATYDETLKKVNLAPEVILGDLSALNNDKLKLKSGLYAKNAYLEGSFYANQDGKNKVSLDDKGINLGNALVYDTETDTLWLGASTIIHDKYKEGESIESGRDDLDFTEVEIFDIKIDSNNGTYFRNNIGQTSLNARLYKNGKEIDALGTNYIYKWYDKTTNSLVHMGKTYDVTAEDVEFSRSFICEVSQKEEN